MGLRGCAAFGVLVYLSAALVPCPPAGKQAVSVADPTAHHASGSSHEKAADLSHAFPFSSHRAEHVHSRAVSALQHEAEHSAEAVAGEPGPRHSVQAPCSCGCGKRAQVAGVSLSPGYALLLVSMVSLAVTESSVLRFLDSVRRFETPLSPIDHVPISF